jgi:hypothetical protein
MRPRDDVVDVALEPELRRVDPEHRQPEVAILRLPGLQIRRRAQPVDAGVGPEVDGDDPAAESVGCQRLGVEPASRTVEGGKMPLDGQLRAVPGEAVPERSEEAGADRRLGDRRRAADAIGGASVIGHTKGVLGSMRITGGGRV